MADKNKMPHKSTDESEEDLDTLPDMGDIDEVDDDETDEEDEWKGSIKDSDEQEEDF